jgi:formate-dependent nitrite reductase cytochrome c552 subunit
MADELRMPWEKKYTPEKVREDILSKANPQPPAMRRSNSPLSPRFIAARDGKHTFEGDECKHCANTQRYVNNGGCVACHVRRDQMRRDAKKEAKARALREKPVILPDQP